jgi:hypothetical protein
MQESPDRARTLQLLEDLNDVKALLGTALTGKDTEAELRKRVPAPLVKAVSVLTSALDAAAERVRMVAEDGYTATVSE